VAVAAVPVPLLADGAVVAGTWGAGWAWAVAVAGSSAL
jgi:hypothetical protein